jgi:hypothetical protein
MKQHLAAAGEAESVTPRARGLAAAVAWEQNQWLLLNRWLDEIEAQPSALTSSS